jgi:hypothetical protein
VGIIPERGLFGKNKKGCEPLEVLEPIRITLSIAGGVFGSDEAVFRYACGDFAPAALASGFSLDLITKELFG